MNIAFDLDGVLYPWHEAIYTELSVRYGEALPSFEELWSDPYKYFNEDKWKFFASIPLPYSTITPRPAVLELLRDLDKAGHSLYYITNRWEDKERITRKYLNDHNFPQAGGLIHTPEKERYIRALEIDIIVEDKPKNLEKFAGLCTTYGILQPHNRKDVPYLESLGVIFVPAVECLRDILC